MIGYFLINDKSLSSAASLVVSWLGVQALIPWLGTIRHWSFQVRIMIYLVWIVLGVIALVFANPGDMVAPSSSQVRVTPPSRPTQVGRDPAKPDPRSQDLNQLASYCQEFTEAHGQWPTHLSQLEGYLDRDPEQRRRLTDGSLVFVDKLVRTRPNRIIAYDKNSPEVGGWTLFASGLLVKLPNKQAFATANAPRPPSEPEAQDLMDRLAKTYRELKTYRDTTEAKVTTIDAFGTGKRTVFEMTSSTVFIPPNQLRVEFQTQVPSSPELYHYAMRENGSELRRHSGRDAMLGPPRSLNNELGAVAGGSWFLVHNVAHLLVDTQGIPPYLSDLDNAQRIDDGNVAGVGVVCQRVQGTSGTWNVTIWVDPASGLLRRLELRNRFTEASMTLEAVANMPIAD